MPARVSKYACRWVEVYIPGSCRWVDSADCKFAAAEDSRVRVLEEV